MTYIEGAVVAWVVGFLPLTEIYVAVPAAMAVGLDGVSAVVWSVFGNITPVVLIAVFYERLLRNPRFNRWMTRISGRSETFQRRINRYGAVAILFIAPITGVWVLSASAKALGMDNARLLIFTTISITIYGVLIAITVQAGVDLAQSVAG